MFKPKKKSPISESEARNEIARVYHEIKQTLRVSGINLNFRTWAGFGNFLPLMWDEIRPIARLKIFETASDEIRAESVRLVETLGKMGPSAARLGPSQTYQVQKALELYHYINPKLLLLTSLVLLRLRSNHRFLSNSIEERGDETILGGVPANMYPMEMVSDKPDDARLVHLFAEIKKTLSLSSINSDYRTLALWPDYLSSAWERLKPVISREDYTRASDLLRESAFAQARRLPAPAGLTSDRIREIGQDPAEIIQTTESFERLLPSLIMNISLLGLDWHEPNELRRSPFPARFRKVPAPRMAYQESYELA